MVFLFTDIFSIEILHISLFACRMDGFSLSIGHIVVKVDAVTVVITVVVRPKRACECVRECVCVCVSILNSYYNIIF